MTASSKTVELDETSCLFEQGLSGDKSTIQPQSQVMIQPGGQAMIQPGGQAAIQPGGQAMIQPGGQAAIQPGGQAVIQPTITSRNLTFLLILVLFCFLSIIADIIVFCVEGFESQLHYDVRQLLAPAIVDLINSCLRFITSFPFLYIVLFLGRPTIAVVRFQGETIGVGLHVLVHSISSLPMIYLSVSFVFEILSIVKSPALKDSGTITGLIYGSTGVSFLAEALLIIGIHAWSLVTYPFDPDYQQYKLRPLVRHLIFFALLTLGFEIIFLLIFLIIALITPGTSNFQTILVFFFLSFRILSKAYILSFMYRKRMNPQIDILQTFGGRSVVFCPGSPQIAPNEHDLLADRENLLRRFYFIDITPVQNPPDDDDDDVPGI